MLDLIKPLDAVLTFSTTFTCCDSGIEACLLHEKEIIDMDDLLEAVELLAKLAIEGVHEHLQDVLLALADL